MTVSYSSVMNEIESFIKYPYHITVEPIGMIIHSHLIVSAKLLVFELNGRINLTTIMWRLNYLNAQLLSRLRATTRERLFTNYVTFLFPCLLYRIVL